MLIRTRPAVGVSAGADASAEKSFRRQFRSRNPQDGDIWRQPTTEFGPPNGGWRRCFAGQATTGVPGDMPQAITGNRLIDKYHQTTVGATHACTLMRSRSQGWKGSQTTTKSDTMKKWLSSRRLWRGHPSRPSIGQRGAVMKSREVVPGWSRGAGVFVIRADMGIHQFSRRCIGHRVRPGTLAAACRWILAFADLTKSGHDCRVGCRGDQAATPQPRHPFHRIVSTNVVLSETGTAIIWVDRRTAHPPRSPARQELTFFP